MLEDEIGIVTNAARSQKLAGALPDSRPAQALARAGLAARGGDCFTS